MFKFLKNRKAEHYMQLMEKFRNENIVFKKTNKQQEEHLLYLQKTNNELMNENNTLTEWIVKILDEFGSCSTEDKEYVLIPRCEKIKMGYAKDDETGYMKPIKEIIVPRIVIRKMDFR